MKRPILSRMYETFIKIDPRPDPLHQIIFQTIKTKVYPTIEQLKKDGKVDWHSFLIHNRRSGVPTTDDDNNAYFHIRFSLSKEANEDEILKILPDFCVLTRKVNPSNVKSISISNTMKYDVVIPVEEIWSLLHYFHNMVGLSVIQCQNCKTTFLI
jgi:hypothetical protein